MMLVNSDPGPSVMRSALAIASRVSCIGLTPRRLQPNSLDPRSALAEILVSPSTFDPSARVASSTTFVAVDGKILPQVARTSEAC